MTYETGDKSEDSEEEEDSFLTLEQTGLKNMIEDCDPTTPYDCQYRHSTYLGEFYPPKSSILYYGRGPIHLRWNHKYG